jgi:hypothetical protein
MRKIKTFADAVIRALASIKFAVCLMVSLAVIVAFATILETKHGRQYSQWFVYHQAWFVGLLGLLAASVFSAAYVRFPWKRHQTGFVITHAGLLVLFVGSFVTYWRGIEGQVTLVEGTSTDQLTLIDRCQITVQRIDRQDERPYVFAFESGPVDWKPETSLDIGTVDGVSARVLRYYQRSRPVENWVADSTGRGGPRVRFRLEGSHGGGRIEQELTDPDYGAEIFVGPIAIRLQRAMNEAMLADFSQPATSDLGKKGLLTIYYEDRVEHVKVDEKVGQAVAIGDSGATVELVQFLGNAKLDAAGKFQPLGEDLRNPLVELSVKLPDDETPYRQVAFAKSPLLNFDGVYERECPVKFVYQHPAIKPQTSIEFMQSANGKLYGRTSDGGKIKQHGEVTNGSCLEVSGGFTFTLVDYLPHVRREVTFEPAKSQLVDGASPASAAAHVEIAIGNSKKTVWLGRDVPKSQTETFEVGSNPMRAYFTTAQIPLEFSIELVAFQRELNPGKSGNAAYTSVVKIKDEERQVEEERLVAMNEPLAYRGLRFYQSSFRDAGHGKEASIFTVACDPGRPLKYAGSLMICVGIATMFYMRSYFFAPAMRVDLDSSNASDRPVGELITTAA